MTVLPTVHVSLIPLTYATLTDSNGLSLRNNHLRVYTSLRQVAHEHGSRLQKGCLRSRAQDTAHCIPLLGFSKQ